MGWVRRRKKVKSKVNLKDKGKMRKQGITGRGSYGADLGEI